MTRHEFLAALHDLLRPAVYLEIGVQHGTSLRLAHPNTIAWGVDPDPLCTDLDHAILRMTSDQFFAQATPVVGVTDPVDLGFIDGMHLVEYALRDFIGMERLSHPGGVIVFDDVLPRNQAEARRAQCPGDWTGDVWRMDELLSRFRPDLNLTLVDTDPTGLLIVTRLDPTNRQLTLHADSIASRWPAEDTTVPEDVLSRKHSWHPAAALDAIRDWRRTLPTHIQQEEDTP